uniref:Uncharacterized protein n=1 Tax=Chrysotila carterae TaxID=13221 RepID=A0A6T0AEL7_CHRCT
MSTKAECSSFAGVSEWHASTPICAQFGWNGALVCVRALAENRIGSRGILQLAEALKHNKTLTDLKLKDSEDSISSFEVILLADAVRANTTLTTLEISDNCFGVKDLVPLPDKLRSGASLAKLKLHEENLDELWSDDVVALTKALKISTGLTELNVEGMSIGSRGVVSVVKAATSHSSLTKLNVAGNKIEPKGIIALVNILKADTTLKFLNVADNELGLAGAEAMANMLETNTTLNSLSVRGCKLGREEIIPIVQALEKNTGLIELDLAAQRHIGATGVAALTKALMKNARLNSLDVTGLHIYPFEIALLAGALRNGIPNPTDTLLTVAKGKKYQKGDELPSPTSYWHNGSYHDDADLLFESLMINESLTSLHFSRKSIHLENIRPLTKALEKKSALTVLDLSGNRIESDGVAALAALLPEAEGGPPSAAQLFQDRGQPPRGLRRLALAKALITSTAIRPLANALEKNSSLTALDLAGNFILSDGGILFAKVLKVNRSLTRLDLGEVHRSECVPELVEALRVNTTMTELKFTANGQDQDQIDFLKEKMEENKKLRWNILPLILLPTNLLRLEWLPCHQRELKPRPKATLVEIPMDMREIIADFLHNFL